MGQGNCRWSKDRDDRVDRWVVGREICTGGRERSAKQRDVTGRRSEKDISVLMLMIIYGFVYHTAFCSTSTSVQYITF